VLEHNYFTKSVVMKILDIILVWSCRWKILFCVKEFREASNHRHIRAGDMLLPSRRQCTISIACYIEAW